MKATGIIRRIDDLGRVVIPREICRSCGIVENMPLEIFVDKSPEGQPMICFAKFEHDHMGDARALFDNLWDEYGHDDPKLDKMWQDMRTYLTAKKKESEDK